MVEESNIPAEDDAAHWGPIVAQRLADYRAVIDFLEEHRQQIPMHIRMLIKSQGLDVLKEHGDGEHWPVEWGAQPPANALWAGILRQARHAMIESMMLYCPESYLMAPREGESRPKRER